MVSKRIKVKQTLDIWSAYLSPINWLKNLCKKSVCPDFFGQMFLKMYFQFVKYFGKQDHLFPRIIFDPKNVQVMFIVSMIKKIIAKCNILLIYMLLNFKFQLVSFLFHGGVNQ